MALQVGFFLCAENLNWSITGVGPSDIDYEAVSGEVVQFNIGDTYQTHTIYITDNIDCGDVNDEIFFSIITINSGIQPIHVINPQATVTIDEPGEAECSEFCVHSASCSVDKFCNSISSLTRICDSLGRSFTLSLPLCAIFTLMCTENICEFLWLLLLHNARHSLFSQSQLAMSSQSTLLLREMKV